MGPNPGVAFGLYIVFFYFFLLTSFVFQIAAISEQSSESSSTVGADSSENANGSPEWRSFDMHSVIAATEDLFDFILSRKGWRVRVFLVQDIVKASDVFLQEATFPYIFDNVGKIGDINPEVS